MLLLPLHPQSYFNHFKSPRENAYIPSSKKYIGKKVVVRGEFIDAGVSVRQGVGRSSDMCYILLSVFLVPATIT